MINNEYSHNWNSTKEKQVKKNKQTDPLDPKLIVWKHIWNVWFIYAPHLQSQSVYSIYKLLRQNQNFVDIDEIYRHN